MSSTYTTIEDPDSYEIIRVLMLGDYNVGKGAVLYRYKDDLFSDSRSYPIGYDSIIKNIIVDEERIIKFQILDLNGDEKYRRISPNYYSNASGYVLVCDVTNKESTSIKNVSKWLGEIKKYSDNIPNPPIVIVCNKCDLLNDTKIDLTELSEYCSSLSIPLIQNVSAKENINVDLSFDTLIKLIINRDDYPPESVRIIDRTSEEYKKKKNYYNNNNNNNKSCSIL